MKFCERCGKELIEDGQVCCIPCIIELLNKEAKEKGLNWQLVRFPGGVKKVPIH